jgi:hypothetical protein
LGGWITAAAWSCATNDLWWSVRELSIRIWTIQFAKFGESRPLMNLQRGLTSGLLRYDLDTMWLLWEVDPEA